MPATFPPYESLTGTFANIPSSAPTGTMYLATDIGTNGTLFTYNGSVWRPVGGQCVLGTSGNSVSHTGDTNKVQLGSSVLVPANIMGANGYLEIDTLWALTNNGDAKTCYVWFGASGTGGSSYLNANLNGNLTFQITTRIRNVNATNSQVGFTGSTGYWAGGSGSNTNNTSSIDTTQNQYVSFGAQLAFATDTVALSSYTVKLIVP